MGQWGRATLRTRHWGRDFEDTRLWGQTTLRTDDFEDRRLWGQATLRTGDFEDRYYKVFWGQKFCPQSPKMFVLKVASKCDFEDKIDKLDNFCKKFQQISKILDIWCQHLGDEHFYWIYAANIWRKYVILRVSVWGMCIFYWIYAAKIWEYMSFGVFLGALRAQGWEMCIF